MNDSKIEIGKRLAEIRKSKKLKQEDFKELIDAPTVQMISSWENGHASISTTYLIIIAKKLDISLDYLLLGRKDVINQKKNQTYKDVAQSLIDLTENKLFNLYKRINDVGLYDVCVSSANKTLVQFYDEYNNLLIASKSLKPELYNQAIIDLLEKYDFPLDIDKK